MSLLIARIVRMNEQRVLDISWGTIGKLALVGFSLYTVFLIRDILAWTLFGIVIAVIFDPVISALQKLKIPRVISAVSVYLAVFGLIAFMVYGMIPFFVSEIQRFSQLLPQYFETIAPFLKSVGFDIFTDVQAFVDGAVGGIENVGSSILNVLFSIFGGLFAAFFIISIAIFLSTEESSMSHFVNLAFSKKYETTVINLWERSRKKVAGWFLSRVLASVFVGGATYVALLLFNVQYPLSLSLLTGISNIIPIVGPLVTGLFTGMIVALDSVTKALFVVLTLVLIQQIEGNVVTPVLSKKLIGISPVLVLVSLAVGAKLWGVMGAILSLPLAAVLFEFLQDYLKKRKEI